MIDPLLWRTFASQHVLSYVGLPLIAIAYYKTCTKTELRLLHTMIFTGNMFAIGELYWNIWYLLAEKPSAGTATFANPVFTSIFTLIAAGIAFKTYERLDWKRWAMALTTQTAYMLAWVSIGFPITINIAVKPVETIWFYSPIVNGIEIAYWILWTVMITISLITTQKHAK